MVTCKNCSKQFEITDRDRAFYKKVDVPEPTHCPDCRQQRRLAFRNERTLYSRACDLCKKQIVSIYPAKDFAGAGTGPKFPVYCPECWWGDSWEGTQFGLDYNPAKPFFEQAKELQTLVPRIGNLAMNCQNSDYTNNTADLKNCYLIYASENDEDCYYGRLIQQCKNVVDCNYTYDSERCYECSDIHNCYGAMFSQMCQTSTDILFGYNLSGCSNCILCTNLRNKTNCIENKQCTKEEYEKRKAEILASRESVEAARRIFDKMKGEMIVKFASNIKCSNATGDYLYNCHDSYNTFDTSGAKDCAYVADGLDPIDFYDGNNIYYKPELCYELMGVLKTYNCKFCIYIFYASNLIYCDSCHHTDDSVACVGLKKNQYCILNKQYTKEEYEKLRLEIVERLRKENIYGEQFPVTMSPFAYNETLAASFYPMSKDECVARGWVWQDNMPGTFGKTGPDLLACTHCGKNFKYTKQELEFYKSFGLPLPVMAPECRLLERLKLRNPRKLWSGVCKCTLGGHETFSDSTMGHAKGTKCTNEFQTSYSPERPEKVYCEECYLKEVI